MINNDSCVVAFIGAGYMTTEHIKAFKYVPGVELAGIHSRTRDRAAKLAQEFGVPLVCDSVAELYDKTKADLVVVSVPELSVCEVCLDVFLHPWASLIEKPAGYDLADAQRILANATAQKRQAFVALNRRHHSSTRLVLADLAQQKGARLIHVYDQEDQIAARKAGQPELVVQNWMYANSIHMIDYFSILGRGNIISVDPIVPWSPQNPSFVIAKISYDSGDIGIYEAVWNGPGPWAISVTTQEKRWEMRPLEQASSQPYGSRKLEPASIHEWDTAFKPGLRVQAEEAVKAAKRKPHGLPSLEDAMKSMKLAAEIYGLGSKHD
jgi:predicted dehydrogenase